MIPIDPCLLNLAAAGLAGAPLPARRGWDDRLDEVFAHGLAGFLAASAAAGHVDLGPGTTGRLETRLEAEAISAVRLEGELGRLATLLDDVGAVLLKGSVLAHGAYPDPLLRPFTDLDILVPGHRLEGAVRALADHGYRRSRPEPSPGFDSHIGKSLVLTHPGGVVIDLHRTLAAGLAGATIDVDELVAARIVVAAGAVLVPAPSWEAHLVECALHAVVGDGLTRALSVRDVAQVAWHPELDVAAVVVLARRWQVEHHLETALRAVVDGLGAALPEHLEEAARRAAFSGPALPASVRSAQGRIDELRRSNRRKQVALTRALVAPSPAFLRWSYGNGSLPLLYVRRWRSLYRRAVDAHRQHGARDRTARRHEHPGRVREIR